MIAAIAVGLCWDGLCRPDFSGTEPTVADAHHAFLLSFQRDVLADAPTLGGLFLRSRPSRMALAPPRGAIRRGRRTPTPIGLFLWWGL